MEIYATNYIASYVTKRGKRKTKKYSSYYEWLYNRAPICDEIIVVEDEAQEIYIAAIIEKWEKEIKNFLNSRSYCGRGAKILNIKIEYEITRKKYCADMSINECLKIMTPKQFFDEFGEFTADNMSNI